MSYTGPSYSPEWKELHQPLVDLMIDSLVELGLKSEKWAKQDRLSDEWHYVGDKITFYETGMPYGYMLLPDDPAWREIIQLAIGRMVEVGARTIKPNGPGSDIVRQLEIARDDYLATQEPSPAFIEAQRRRTR
ncbi:MAG: hypothetical protein J0H98_04360 [Solirubrobacterales bacterium]|nr:hypothetical protein [Solirubrobacterales bacterium]